MAYPVNSIGGVPFIALEGSIELVQSSVELIQRANVAGLDTRILPPKGRPFRLVSTSSHANQAAAITAYKSYLDLKESGVVTLIRNDINYETSHSQKVKVLDVLEPRLQIATAMSGNVSGSDTYFMSCVWLLVMASSV